MSVLREESWYDGVTDILKLAAEKENDVAWRVLVPHMNVNFVRQCLERASSEFIIKLFDEEILTPPEHGMEVMLHSINNEKRQAVVKFLHSKGVPIRIYDIHETCGLRTAIILVPEQVKAFRGSNGSTALDRFVLNARGSDRATMREDVDALLALGLKFTEGGVFDMITTFPHTYLQHAEHVDLHTLVTPATFEGDFAKVVTSAAHKFYTSAKLLRAWHGYIDLSNVRRDSLSRVLRAMWREEGMRGKVLQFMQDVTGEDVIFSHGIMTFGKEIVGDNWHLGAIRDLRKHADVVYHGVHARGMAPHILSMPRFHLLPCSAYPSLAGVEGVETWLAAGKTPRFMLSIARKCRTIRGRPNMGLVALVALIRFGRSKEWEDRKILKISRLGMDDADVAVGLALRRPQGGVDDEMWRAKVLAPFLRLELPVNEGPWAALGRAPWRM